MTQTLTKTETYTVADVKNVFEQVAAGLLMIARTTGLWTSDHAENVASDIRTFAEAGYLECVDIVLRSDGKVMRAHSYEVSHAASAWKNAGPQGNLWPRTANGDLTVVLRYSAAWKALPASKQQGFRNALRIGWSPSDIDLTYPGLTQGATLRHASRGYGVERQSYERAS